MLLFFLPLFLSLFSGDHPFFLESFDGPDSGKVRASGAHFSVVTDTFRNAGIIARRDSMGSATAQFTLDPHILQGRRIQLSAWCKAQRLTSRPYAWNGVKVMLVLTDSSGHVEYPQLVWPDVNEWPWRRSERSILVAWSLKSASLVVGLESVAGQATFDSLRIDMREQVIHAPARDPKLLIPDFSPARLRGAMIGTDALDTTGLRLFGEVWHGNLLRWQLNGPRGSEGLIDPNFDRNLSHSLAVLDSALPLCRRYGIRVLVDLHGLSGHLFYDTVAQARLIETWRRLVQRYRNESSIWGWDLSNEPSDAEFQDGLLDWNELTDTLARVVRALDAQKIIVVEPLEWASPSGFNYLQPVGWKRGYDISRVVYSFHFYVPISVTHQGVGRNATGIHYPGLIDGQMWDSAALRRALAPAYEFQQRYRVPMYVGEFSCIRWAPDSSAYRWLRDATNLFEEAGWDWSYHAFREWQGWSVEYPSGSHDTAHPVDTDRKRLLLDLFAKNKRVGF